MKKLGKKLYIGLFGLTILISVSALFIIFKDETSCLKNEWITQKVLIKGSYKIDNERISTVLTEDYRFHLSGRHLVSVVGRLNQEIPKNKMFIMRIDNLRVRILINGKLVYSFGNKENMPNYINSAGNVWDYFISPGIKKTDKVEIELENQYTDHGDTVFKTFLDNLYCGYENEIIHNKMQNSLVNSFAAVLIICIGICAFIASCILIYLKKSPYVMLAFTGTAIFGGIWTFIDFEIQEYFFPYPIFNNSLDMLALYFTVAFAMLYIGIQLKSKLKKMITGFSCIWLFLILSSTTEQFMGIRDYYDYIPAVKIFGIISACTISIAMIAEWITHKGKQIKNLFISSIFLFLGAWIDIGTSLFGILTRMTFFKIGFLVFLLLQIAQMGQLARQFFEEKSRVRELEILHTSQTRVLEYQELLTKATRGLYDSIYEFNITKNCGVGASTQEYFESLGIPSVMPYDQAIKVIASRQIKEEYVEGYIDTFSLEHILSVYKKGIDNLSYDFEITFDGDNYYWMRIMARIFFMESDNSVRMITFRQNIDEEKKHEQELFEQAQKDALTGLYNKAAAEEKIKKKILSDTQSSYAFYMFDIDNFKGVNDNFGHVFGDFVITSFAEILKKEFGMEDIVGRNGGDEFAAFAKLKAEEDLEEKTKKILKSLCREISVDGIAYQISASIGIAVYPIHGTEFIELYRNADTALYKTKNNGKNSYTIYSKEAEK